MKPRLLVVDESPAACAALQAALEDRPWIVDACTDPAELPALLQEETRYDVVLTDQDVLDVATCAELLDVEDPPAWIALKSFGSIQDAVETVRAGASDYLSKPADPDQLCMAVERALQSQELQRENARLRADLEGRYEFGRIETRDPQMRRVFETARAVADARATVLLEGESGTGKTLLARTIHQASSRASAAFVEVNCGALPESLLESELFGHVRGAFTGAVRDKAGKFELADGGTIFLDEIGCAPLELQVKLLRVLQDRVFERVGGEKTLDTDVRVLAATNADLKEEVAAGRFREDLYYRLHVVTLSVPPLRERPGDLRLLADRFLSRFADEYERSVRRYSAEALRALMRHGWPGNVRELENAVERAVLLSPPGESEVSEGALPDELRDPSNAGRKAGAGRNETDPTGLDGLEELLRGGGPLPTLREALEGPEERILRLALAIHGGNRKETAAMLGVNRTTLFNKMRKYALLDVDFTADSALALGETPPRAAS